MEIKAMREKTSANSLILGSFVEIREDKKGRKKKLAASDDKE